jgi:hypothetical protein
MFGSILSIGVAIIGTIAPLVNARCQWITIQGQTDIFFEAQEFGIMDPALLTGEIKYMENNKTVDITKGLLSKEMKIAHRRTIFDQDGCATYSEVIVTDATTPWVLGVQIHFNEETETGATFKTIDIIATTTGDWQFNATKTLLHTESENWDTIDASKRDNRELLKQAADAYLDMWGNPESPVPWGTPCRRLEGSAYTGTGEATDNCNVGTPTAVTKPVVNRRYVIDENVGAINVMAVFGAMMDAPDSHEFRLEGGKLRYVHSMTVLRNLTAV